MGWCLVNVCAFKALPTGEKKYILFQILMSVPRTDSHAVEMQCVSTVWAVTDADAMLGSLGMGPLALVRESLSCVWSFVKCLSDGLAIGRRPMLTYFQTLMSALKVLGLCVEETQCVATQLGATDAPATMASPEMVPLALVRKCSLFDP